MTFKLRGKGQTFEILTSTWQRLLDLARSYGWKPAGTRPPDVRDQEGNPACDWSDWSGSYTVNEYQNVTGEDAKNLAEALELALLDIPQYSVIERDAPGVFSGVRGVDTHKQARPVEWFNHPIRRAELVAFITFCREGGFEIG